MDIERRIQLIVGVLTLLSVLGLALTNCDIQFGVHFGVGGQGSAGIEPGTPKASAKDGVARCPTEDDLRNPESKYRQWVAKAKKVDAGWLWENCGLDVSNYDGPPPTATPPTIQHTPTPTPTPTATPTPTPTCFGATKEEAPWCFGPSDTPTPTPSPTPTPTPRPTPTPTPTAGVTGATTPTAGSAYALDTTSKSFYPSGALAHEVTQSERRVNGDDVTPMPTVTPTPTVSDFMARLDESVIRACAHTYNAAKQVECEALVSLRDSLLRRSTSS